MSPRGPFGFSLRQSWNKAFRAPSSRQKIYLKRGYPSLFEYLKKHLKYSNGTAQRRIDAARLMKDFPALTEKLESGDLNPGQVTLVQMALRQKTKETREGVSHQKNSFADRNASHGSKESQVPVSREEKQDLIESLMGKSEWESQQMLAQALDLRIQTRTKAQVQKDESVRLEVTLSKEQWEKLEKMRELLSTSIPDGSWSEVLEHVAEKVIHQKAHSQARCLLPVPRPEDRQAMHFQMELAD